jgi:hypothetical protein
MNRYDSLIDEALDRYPMQPLPAGFTKRVISRLPAPQPRFHLDFLDLILPVFFCHVWCVGLVCGRLGRFLHGPFMAVRRSITDPTAGVGIVRLSRLAGGILGSGDRQRIRTGDHHNLCLAGIFVRSCPKSG